MMRIKGSERKEFTRMAATQCMVLLKNDAQTLPLTGGRVAVFGRGQLRTVKGGTGSGEVNNVINILDGLRGSGVVEVYEPLTEAYTKWDQAHPVPVKSFPEIADPSNPEMPLDAALISEAAAQCDSAVLVISRVAGEGGDRKLVKGDYYLQDEEQAMIDAVCTAFAGKRVILLLNVCGVSDLSFLDDRIGAVLFVSLPGQEAGNAIADLLCGKVTPSGKLADTWPFSYEDCPAQNFGTGYRNGNHMELPAFPYGGGTAEQAEIHYNEGIYVGYRGYDANNTPVRYPFGFGLSYTQFSVTPGVPRVDGSAVTVQVSVRNIGTQYSGREVVQVYVCPPEGTVPKARQVLAGYQKTKLLAPGESEELQISFDLSALASYSEAQQAWLLEQGVYEVRLGTDSRSTERVGLLELPSTVVTAQWKNLFPGYADKLTPMKKSTPNEAVTGDAIQIDPSVFVTETICYDEPEQPAVGKPGDWTLDDVRAGRCSIDDLTARMETAELTALCTGMGMGPVGGMAFTVGSLSLNVNGSAGQTHEFYDKYRIPPLVLADGPAGIRITQSVKDDDGVEIMQQNCTAYPIGTLIASSWDPELAYAIGKSVGEEMREQEIDLWLAPGMNIHRNPLCGRNFEYFSEDPLVTGLTAAAITRGVQSNGVGVTVKHFAGNNQEDMREISNSVISEQALREIYLKGFELVIKLAKPWAIMTSYNDINGTPAADNHALCTDFARCECGFDGLIMTDWGGGMSTPAISICNGNDMIQPGGEAVVAELTEAFTSCATVTSKGGSHITATPTRDALRRAAGRILRIILRRYPDPIR
jgi:beta-glucosidase